MKIIHINKWNLAFIAVVSIVSYLLHYFTGMPLWEAVLIVMVALVVNGFIAEWEDNRPGGINAPDAETEDKEK